MLYLLILIIFIKSVVQKNLFLISKLLIFVVIFAAYSYCLFCIYKIFFVTLLTLGVNDQEEIKIIDKCWAIVFFWLYICYIVFPFLLFLLSYIYKNKFGMQSIEQAHQFLSEDQFFGPYIKWHWKTFIERKKKSEVSVKLVVYNITRFVFFFFVYRIILILACNYQLVI